MELRGTQNDCSPELDHIIPLSRGGHHAHYNIQIACHKCNANKGNRIYAQDRLKSARLWPTEPLIIPPKNPVSNKPTCRNRTGVRGVFLDGHHMRWVAQIERDGKRIRKMYKTLEEAIAARKRMECKDASETKSNIIESYFTRRKG